MTPNELKTSLALAALALASLVTGCADGTIDDASAAPEESSINAYCLADQFAVDAVVVGPVVDLTVHLEDADGEPEDHHMIHLFSDGDVHYYTLELSLNLNDGETARSDESTHYNCSDKEVIEGVTVSATDTGTGDDVCGIWEGSAALDTTAGDPCAPREVVPELIEG
jgi:hypothetical protein